MSKRVYLLDKVEKDDGWKGGTLPVPFKAAGASSVSFGSLTASNDIAEDKYVRGEISSQKELWGSMIFNQRDLYEHDSKKMELSFLQLLPDAIDDFMDYMKYVVSCNLTNGEAVCTLLANGDVDSSGGSVTGNAYVDRPDRLRINQKLQIDDGNSAAATVYVKSINMNTKDVVLSDTRGGSAWSISAYTTAQSAKLYLDNSIGAGFTSLKSVLLSAANGGDSTLYGQSKVLYPYLQAINVSGASITATNILDKIFDAFVTVRQFGKGNPTEIMMSYKHWGSILKLMELQTGAYRQKEGSSKASIYGWDSITLTGIKGTLTFTAVQEMDDDFMAIIDWRAFKFHSNGFFRKRVAPDGKQYYEVRNTSGYQYIVDICLFGDMVISRPSYCGIIHTISY
jgi:hypothetical protein